MTGLLLLPARVGLPRAVGYASAAHGKGETSGLSAHAPHCQLPTSLNKGGAVTIIIIIILTCNSYLFRFFPFPFIFHTLLQSVTWKFDAR